MAAASSSASIIGIPGNDENPVERRRLLNILAQRRYRQRKRNITQRHGCTLKAPTPVVDRSDVAEAEAGEDLIFGMWDSSAIHVDADDMWPSFESPGDALNCDVTAFAEPVNTQPGETLLMPSHNTSTVDSGSSSFVSQTTPTSAFADYAITTPGLSVVRAKVDIFNAMYGQGITFNIWNPQAVSPLCLTMVVNRCPANMWPTQLQHSIPHHPAIDLFPWPSFRDRFLFIMSLPKPLRPQVAQDDMSNVMLELMLAVKDAGGGIRVWGANAWDESHWEIGQEFFRKFWWTLDARIIQNSNRHRQMRGEGPLRF